MIKMQGAGKQKAPPEIPPGAGAQIPPEAAAPGEAAPPGKQAKALPALRKPEKIELSKQAEDVRKETLPKEVRKPDVTYNPKIKGLSIAQHYFSSGEVEQIPNSVQQTVPGWTLFALFWIAQILAMNLLAERQSGAYRRLLVSPLGRWRYFAGKIIPFFIINLVQAVFMFGIGVYILPLLGADALELRQIGALSLLTVAFSLVSIGFGFLFAAFSRTLAMGATLAATLAVVMAAVGGVMVPKFVMPHYLQMASFSVPHGWALEGYLDILVRGRGMEDILPNAAVLLLFALISTALAMLRFRIVDRNE
jgi:ABC-2 type transport system permease protein